MFLFDTYNSYLQEIYKEDKELSKQLKNLFTLFEKSITDPSLFDDIVTLIENSYGLIEHEEKYMRLDRSQFGLDSDARLVSHTMDSLFMGSMYDMYMLKQKDIKPDSLNIVSPYTMKPRTKFMLEVDTLNAPINSLYEMRNHEGVLIQTSSMDKAINKRGPDVVR